MSKYPTVIAEAHHVAVLGASPKPARYANQCIRLLKQHDFRITPIHPRFEIIEALDVSPALGDIQTPVDTLTLYVGPTLLEPQTSEILRLQPERVIFNPGTESLRVQEALSDAGIAWCEACTLVLLKTGQFLETCSSDSR